MYVSKIKWDKLIHELELLNYAYSIAENGFISPDNSIIIQNDIAPYHAVVTNFKDKPTYDDTIKELIDSDLIICV